MNTNTTYLQKLHYSAILTTSVGRGGIPCVKKFLIGLMKISQVTLVVAGGGIRTPRSFWPATPRITCRMQSDERILLVLSRLRHSRDD